MIHESSNSIIVVEWEGNAEEITLITTMLPSEDIVVEFPRNEKPRIFIGSLGAGYSTKVTMGDKLIFVGGYEGFIHERKKDEQ